MIECTPFRYITFNDVCKTVLLEIVFTLKLVTEAMKPSAVCFLPRISDPKYHIMLLSLHNV